MRNLKRALSLALAAMMLIGMMVVSAGAASKDFTDKDEIKHPEAVNTLVTLNVIAGKEDGSYFDPTGTLTRAEMAKLATYVLNGGVEPVLGTKVTPTYTDIKGHWAEAYIEYCTSMGIIVGDGTGKFNPEGTLTASQCAKMLLTAMNYKDDIFGFTGNSWEINVNREANAAGLYDELKGISASSPISRDNAAQMVYNAIQSKTMELTWTQDMATGQISQHYQLTGDPLFVTKFNGTTYEGLLTATGNYDLTALGTSGASASSKGFVVDVDQINGEDAAAAQAKNTYFKFEDQDLTSIIGQNVKVLVGAKNEVYGVYATSDNTVVEAPFSTVKRTSKTGELSIDGTVYDYDNTNAHLYAGETDKGAIASIFGTSTKNNSEVVTFIDNTGDGKIDLAIIKAPVVGVAKVTFANSTSFTTGGTNYKYEDTDNYVFPEAAFAKDDFAIRTTDYYSNKTVFAKAEVVSGKLTGNTGAKWKTNDNWYAAANSTAVYGSAVTYTNDGNALALDKSFDLVLVNGMIYYSELTSSAITDVALVLSAGTAMDADGNYQAKLLKADGTTEVVTVDTNCSGLAVEAAGTMTVNKALVLYEVNDGVYTLTQLNDTNAVDPTKGDFDAAKFNTASSTTYVKSTKTIDGKKIADDATIFVQYVEGGKTYYKVLTGAQMASLGSNFGNKAVYAYSTTGINYVELAFITDGGYLPGAAADKVWGYVVSDVTTTTEDSVTTYSFTVFDGEKDVEVTSKSLDGVAKGDIVSFNYGSDGYITGLTRQIDNSDTTTYPERAIEDFSDSSEIIKFANDATIYSYADDMVVLYVDTENVKGVVGGTISKADKPLGSYVTNAKALINISNEVTLLVVDVTTNDWH